MNRKTPLRRRRLGRTRAATALAAAGALTMSAGFVMFATSPASATNGNNGTVKVGGSEALDEGQSDGPDNEPFVDCEFLIQWYNYDLPEESNDTDVDFTVSFEPWSPTDERTLSVTGVTSGSFNSFTEVSPPTPDHDELYSLDISGPPHKEGAKQGYHVKVTVNTEYSQGNDVKHKVFWYQPCQPPDTESSSDEFRSSCSGGVEKRTITIVKEYIWDDELGWVLEPEANWQTIVGNWTFVRALTTSERAQLGCDQPNPIIENISDSEMSCELGFRSRTGTITKEFVWNGSSWVLEAASQWSTSWNPWSAYRSLTAAESEQLGCVDAELSPAVTFTDPDCDNLEGADWDGNLEAFLDYDVDGDVGPGETVTVTASIEDAYTDEYEFDEDAETEFTHTFDDVTIDDCVLGEETIVPKPKPDAEPTVKGVEVVKPPAAAPTAVAAGLGAGATASPLQNIAQMLVAGGMLLLVAGAWIGLGRREYGSHEA